MKEVKQIGGASKGKAKTPGLRTHLHVKPRP